MTSTIRILRMSSPAKPVPASSGATEPYYAFVQTAHTEIGQPLVIRGADKANTYRKQTSPAGMRSGDVQLSAQGSATDMEILDCSEAGSFEPRVVR